MLLQAVFDSAKAAYNDAKKQQKSSPSKPSRESDIHSERLALLENAQRDSAAPPPCDACRADVQARARRLLPCLCCSPCCTAGAV